MEALTKRILAIVIIAVIGVGVGVGAWYFLLAPGAGEYSWSSKDCPGAPAGLTSDQIIKIGCAGDIGEIQGDANYDGAWYAAKTINEAGGLVVNGTTYYLGVTKEDTDESNTALVTSRGIAAAERLVYNKKVQFALGGFRSEALLAYQEVFMDNKIIFIDTGAATDIFCTNVKNFYTRYKYFFRFMPINSTSLGGEILTTLAGYIMLLNATYPNHDIKQVGILAEDLTWTESLVAALGNLPALTGGWVQLLSPILYDISLSATDMNGYLSELEDDGCDFLIPVISAQGGILMMQQYSQYNYTYQIFGIDVQSQLDTFYEDSGESCAYEAMMQTLHRTNKTESSIAFWDAWLADHDGHEPLYIAVGAYDAVFALVDAMNATQSFNPNFMIPEMETWTKGNTNAGVGGGGAWWPKTHDLVEGYPYGHTLWVQWRANGDKVVIPAPRYAYVVPYGAMPIRPLYPDWMATGAYEIAPWVHTAWS